MTHIIHFKKTATYTEGQETALQTLSRFAWFVAPLLLLSLAIHLFFFGDYYYTFDDSYVFHVYARNLAHGAGFSFNPGEISHAATPLLTFVLAAQHYLFHDGALVSGKIVNMMFSLWATLLLFLIAYRTTSSLMIAIGSCIVWSASALESILSAGPQDFTLFTFLILLCVYWYLFHPRSLWTYFFLSLVILTRYEGALFAVLLFFNHVYCDWKNRELDLKTLLLRMLLAGILPALWFVYIGTHATLLPTSGSAKLDPWALHEIPHFLGGLVIFFLPPLILAAMISGLAQVKERVPQLMFLFVWVTFCMFFYGPFLDNRRYYVHLLPFLGLFALVYIKHVSQRAFRSPRFSQVFVYGLAGFSLLLHLVTNGVYYYNQTRGHHRAGTYHAYKEAGLWIQKNSPPEATYASEEIGVIPYFAQRRLVDFSGWLDLKSKQFRERDGINPQMLSYLSTRRPDFIIINTDLVSEPRQVMLNTDPRLSLAYKAPLLEHDFLLIYACHW